MARVWISKGTANSKGGRKKGLTTGRFSRRGGTGIIPDAEARERVSKNKQRKKDGVKGKGGKIKS